MNSVIEALNFEFEQVNGRSLALLSLVAQPPGPIESNTGESAAAVAAILENIIRSAATVEQTMGGITRRLWDDPFEWTLAEALDSPAKISAYVNEVETARRSAFAFFGRDSDLARQIPAPRELRSLFAVLLASLARANHYQGRAFSLFSSSFDGPLPRMPEF